MEAFAESIMHLESLDDRKYVVNTHVAAQGSSDSIKDYLKTLAAKKKGRTEENDADELLNAFRGGFKGIA